MADSHDKQLDGPLGYIVDRFFLDRPDKFIQFRGILARLLVLYKSSPVTVLSILIGLLSILSFFWFIYEPSKYEDNSIFKNFYHSPFFYFSLLWVVITTLLLLYYLYQGISADRKASQLNRESNRLGTSLYKLENELIKHISKAQHSNASSKSESKGTLSPEGGSAPSTKSVSTLEHYDEALGTLETYGVDN